MQQVEMVHDWTMLLLSLVMTTLSGLTAWKLQYTL